MNPQAGVPVTHGSEPEQRPWRGAWRESFTPCPRRPAWSLAPVTKLSLSARALRSFPCYGGRGARSGGCRAKAERP